MADEPEIIKNDAEHRFEAWVGGELAGFAKYRPSDGIRDFTHTEIEDRFGGQGVGSKMIKQALDTTRDERLQVLPHCPFVRGFIDKNRGDYLDLVPEDRREEFELSEQREDVG